jgi:predicted nucleic acid-binding protein
MTIDAFDSDVLIYAASEHPLGPRIRSILFGSGEHLGSVVLLPETLSKPTRVGDDRELGLIGALLDRIDLKPVDLEVAAGAAEYGAKYGLRAADAIHLATAVVWGAERFHTNNRKDFGPHIEEVEVVWPW